MTVQKPAAVLWDMDGTLVDTEPYWMLAERELVVSFGGEWTPEDGLTLVGQGLETSAAVLQARGVRLSTTDIIGQLTARVLAQAIEHLPWRPGALELLTATREAGIPTALVTMSMRALADHIATALEHPLFDVIVSGDEVENPKPHPEPYERAARLLGVEVTSCLAFEDSIPGLASAVSAGAVVIGVPAHVAIPESPDYALWTTLSGRSVNDMMEHFSFHRSQSSHRKGLV